MAKYLVRFVSKVYTDIEVDADDEFTARDVASTMLDERLPDSVLFEEIDIWDTERINQLKDKEPIRELD